jgi:hypothetical protein
MSKKWTTILVAAAVGMFLLPTMASAQVAVGGCNVTVVDNIKVTDTATVKTYTDPSPYPAGDPVGGITINTTGPLNVNAEGTLERVADLLITDGGAGTCFPANGDVIITFNGTMTLPPTPGSLTFTNFDIYDSKGLGGLTITSATVSQVFAANTTNSQIDLHIGQPGTAGNLLTGALGSGVRVKNIRVNASIATGTCTGAVNGPNGSTTNICASFGGVAFQVAAVVKTLSTAVAGAGQVPGTTAGTVLGAGTQSSNSGLTTAAQVQFTEGFGQSFRFAGTPCTTVVADTVPATANTKDLCYSQVAADIATSATSLTFSVTGIPSGVTVTFPSTMSTSAIAGATKPTSISFLSRSGSTLSNAGGASVPVTVTYDNSNTFGENTAANNMVVETADNPDGGTAVGSAAGTTNPNCKISGTPAALGPLNAGSACDANPKIGVKVGATSQAGTANLWWVFGPAVNGSTALFAGDDIAASATVPPQYTGTSRILVNNKPFFVIAPTRTTLLFPFVSTRGKWNTGMSIANTALDTGVFGAATAGQTGGVTLFFFGVNPDTGAAVTDTINSDLTAANGKDVSSACRGLDASGRVVPGSQTACVVSSLLPLLASKPSNFDGYVIAVTGFNFAHGFSVVLDASGAPFSAVNALVLGGGARGGAAENLNN